MFDSIKKQVDKGLVYFGLSEPTDEVEEKVIRSKASTDISEHQYPSFSQGLPYQYYDEHSQLFYNDYNACLIYRIPPLTGENEAVAEQLDAIIRTKISDTFTLQVILVKHNQVAAQIDCFASQFNNAAMPNLSRLGTSLESYYRKAAKTGFNTRDETRARLTHTEVYIVVDQAKAKRSEQQIKMAFDQFSVIIDSI